MNRSVTDLAPAATPARASGEVRSREALPGPLPRGLAWLLLVGGLVGFAAAFVLTVEKIATLIDPAYQPSCSLNPVLSCGSVMATPQASVFGFPNALLGIAGFAVVAATGAALLAGARLRGWYWLGLQAGVSLGIVFVHWLIGQSLYRIGALCPYCMVVWAVTAPLFLYVTLSTLARSTDRLPRVVRVVADAVGRYHGVLLTVWFVALLALITQRFWYYWSLIAA